MTYTSLNYLLFVAACLLVYGICPKKFRWGVLLCASLGFYAIVCLKYISFILLTGFTTYGGGIWLGRYITKSDAFVKSQRANGARKKSRPIRTRRPEIKSLSSQLYCF